MHKSFFYRLGKFVYRFHRPIILFWIMAILCCMPTIPHVMAPFKSTGFVAEHSESAKANDYLENNLKYSNDSVVAMYTSKTLSANDADFTQHIKKSLEKLKHFPVKHDIIYPADNKNQISKDKHTAYVVILFHHPVVWTQELIQQLQQSIKKPKHMTMLLGGQPILIEDINKQTEEDLYNADIIGVPIALGALILVFGTLVAAVVPVLLGGGCALLMLSTLYVLGHLFTLSIFTINIALLLGLCLSLDYSLFIIYRFRYELKLKTNLSDVISTTLATAGKAVFFSGLAVFVSLSALLLFPINILFSIGIGGLVAVFMAVAIAIFLLPAVLVMLNTRINSLPILRFKKGTPRSFYFWRWLANLVVKNRLIFFVMIMTVLLLLGYPFLNVRLGISDVHILPKEAESRQFFDTYKAKYNENELTPLRLIITTKQSDILSQKNIAKLYRLTERLKDNPLISTVNSIVTTSPRLTQTQYYALYHASTQSKGVRTLLKTTTGAHFTVIDIVSKYNINSDQMQTLIDDLRQLNPGKGLSFQLAGVPLNNRDVLDSIMHIFPYAVVWILVLTYLILMVLLRSVFLPLKAILMNILSLCASYGVLVFVFQEAHLHELLHFSPQGMLDISLLVIIFGALFGFSMDYEVFLLTRIKEAYDTCHDNNQSIIFGIEQSSKIITSAALIVICTCASFMVAQVLMVKEFGLGIAVAILVDAFCIRSILVPATMSLLKQWNWYLPKWLDKLLPK